MSQTTATSTAFPEHCVSRPFTVLFTTELARGRAGAGVHSCSLLPGGRVSA